MRRIFLVAIALALPLYAQDTTFTQATLSGKSFVSGMGAGAVFAKEDSIEVHGGIFIRFLSNGTYRGILGPGQGGEKRIEGKYEIQAGKLHLYFQGRPWLKNGALKIDTSDLKYPYYLQFDTDISRAVDAILKLGFNPGWDNKLYDLSRKTPVNMSVRIDGIEALTVGNKKGITTDAANMRTRPSTDASKCEFYGDPAKDEKTSVLKKNTNIIVLAKTPRREKVGKWENHWYYIEFTDERPDQELIRAWAFGEFIRITDK